MIIGPTMGALADRYGRGRLVFIGTALSVVLLPLPMLGRSMAWLTATWGGTNGVVSAIFALSFTLLSDATSESKRGRVMSFAYLPANLGSAVGSAIGSAVAVYSVWWIFPAASLLTVLGIGMLAWAARVVGNRVPRF